LRVARAPSFSATLQANSAAIFVAFFLSTATHDFFPFQFTRLEEVFFFIAVFAPAVLHCAFVGRQAG